MLIYNNFFIFFTKGASTLANIYLHVDIVVMVPLDAATVLPNA